jgi:hypothetical protein
VVLLPQGLLLIRNRKECKRGVGSVGEVALTERCKSHVHHLFDTIIEVIGDDGSSKWCCSVQRDLHPNVARIQAVSLKWATTVGRDWPIVAESDESAQEPSWEPRAVSAHGPEEAIFTKCTVEVVIQTHLKLRHEKYH